MFGFGLTIISSLLLVYIVWRMSSIRWLSKIVPKKFFLYSGILAWIVMAGGRSFGHDGRAPLTSFADFVGISLTGILFLVFICLFPVDLVAGFGRYFSSVAPHLRGWTILGGCVLSIVATIQGVRPPVIKNYEVPLEKLPKALDGTTLVALSDLHLGFALGPSWLESRVAQVQALKPVIIVLLGDIFEGHGENIEAFVPVFREFSAPFGVWTVDGNHENHEKRSNSRPSLTETDILTLQDEWTRPVPGLILAGRSILRNHDAVVTPPPWNPLR